MSKMSELDLTVNMVIENGEEYVASLKKAAESAERILNEIKVLKDHFTEGAPRAEKKPKKEAPAVTEVKPEPVKEKVYTFDEVRELLSGLSGMGKFQEVKELFAFFNVKRLSAIDPKDYPELVKRAKEIANA